MKRWVEATHKAGMAAIVNVVYNHPGPEGNYLGAFGPYFEGKQTPWGRGMTSRGKARPEVWRYFIENALQWAAAYHVDGIRVDASHALPPAFFAELKRAADNLSRQLGRRIVVIAEDNRNQWTIVRAGAKTAGHTRGADTQWSTDPWHAWRVLHTGERGSYLEDFADDPLASWPAGSAAAGSTRGRPRRAPASRAAPRPASCAARATSCRWATTTSTATRPTGDRLSARVSARVQRSTDFMRYLLPVIPQVFMGDEWGTRTPFLYFVDHGDPGVREATRKGRAEEFRDFYEAAGIEAPDPTAEESKQKSVLDHGEKSQREHARRVALDQRAPPHAQGAPGPQEPQQARHAGDRLPRAQRPGRPPVGGRSRGGRRLQRRRGARPRSICGAARSSRSTIAPARPAGPSRGASLPALHSEEKRFGGSGARVSGFDGADPVVTIPAHGAVYFDRAD